MTSLSQELRYSVRVLLRSPGFAIIAIAALAIGIGANTAIFSLINTLLLQRLPFRDPDRIAIVWERNIPRDQPKNVVAPANFIHWREMNQTFEELAAVSVSYNVVLTGAGEPEELTAQSVSAELFPLMGIQATIGRAFTREENRPNVRVALLSDRVWRRRFNADPKILERPIQLQGNAYSVAGILPAGSSIFDKNVDVWLPIGFTAEMRTPRGRSWQVVGRLKPGVNVDRAQQDMIRVAADLTAMFPDFNTGWSVTVLPIREHLAGTIRPALLVLAGAVAFVLLIACANVANLLLARATARRRELAVRAALGAARLRLVRQLMAESLVLSVAGGACGLLLAWWTLGFVRGSVADRLSIQRLETVGIDGWVLAFTLGTSLLCGCLFGIIPAFTAAGTRLTDALKDGGRTGSGGRGIRARSAFVVAEVALALVLLVGAGLLVRSFMQLLEVNPGFDPSRAITMRISLPFSRYGGEGQRGQFLQRFFVEVGALPGVQAAGAISFLPMNGLGAATSMEIVGKPQPEKGQEPVTDVRVISHGYLAAMGVPLLRGRLFNEGDPADAKGRVIISETMARHHWPGQDPIGKRVRIHWDNLEDEVIGVVGDVKHQGLEVTAMRSMTYWPFARNPYGTMTIAIRTAGEANQVTNAVTSVVRRLDPQLAVAAVRTMEDVVASSVAERRLTMLLLAIFAGAALLLAAVGIYGVIAYSVTQRTQEIGIRMALGAQQRDVLVMVVRQAVVLVGIGMAVGAAGALLLTRLMSGLLFQVKPADPVTFVGVAAVLALVALCASTIPGLRATRVDPVVALRAE